MLRSVKSFDLKKKKILLRVDFNVPMEQSKVVDDFRIRAALPTIQHCLRQGAALVLMSHLGRPKGKVVPSLSLIPVGETLADLLEMPIKFSDDCVSEDSHDVSLGLKPGEIHLLENLRFHSSEIGNRPDFSIALAKHGDIFINDAFGTAHRAHASNVGVTVNFTQKGIGLLMEKELHFLSDLTKKPKRPFVVVLGGAKIGTKLNLILRLINASDMILIGGGMAFTFLKTMGKHVGKSLVDTGATAAAKTILRNARQKVQLIFPEDVRCAIGSDKPDKISVHTASHIPDDQMGLDIGPETIKQFRDLILSAGTVLWNGPMGVFEVEEFSAGTKAIGEALAAATQGGALTVVGGGDSAAAIKKFGLMEAVTHVSTGGGASLELLAGNRLPAIAALEK